ncbi:MAG: division/cell wall cluster transcriptional repressor MraZ [Eubacterium sp.]|nr:division/cell wall cluster transcriptional repressor MraZ [Eubacterium sp.]MCD7778962.1 division/cell wall cluster transcriptional repressor MraZ [Clostridiales bacterium]MCD8159547.1 division/cell wall cluster transcriptional repressor MraZ [Clostridiales bacterium]
MFMGEYIHSIDKKNRIIVPAKFRDELGESFVMTRGYDGCLYVFTTEGYEEFRSKNIGTFSINSPNARKLIRFFAPNPCEADANGRVIIPESLRNHAKIEKDIISVGLNDHIEIWDKSAWEAYTTSDEFMGNEFAEGLL